MAKIAADLKQALALHRARGTSGSTSRRVVATGGGWTVADVLCTCGPQDRPFEERHTDYAIAVVVAGTFEYNSPLGRELMTPASLLLGNPGQSFECAHHHGAGDRCVSFWYTPEYFERLTSMVRTSRTRGGFPAGRLPPLPSMSPLLARAAVGVGGGASKSWEELGIALAGNVMALVSGVPASLPALPNSEARVSRIVRAIDDSPGEAWTGRNLAREAGLSPYHFLRTFERVTGVTPHQYVMRIRLRDAAVALAAEESSVLEIALECGFGDVSNFNRAFKTEFGMSPREYRRRTRVNAPATSTSPLLRGAS